MGKYLKMADEAMGMKAENCGRLAEFHSPLFGRCYGRIVEIKANLYHLSDHSVLKVPVMVPGSWIVRIHDEEATAK